MDIELTRGDDKSFELTFSRNGVVQDITDWTVSFIVKRSKSDPIKDAVIHKEIKSHSGPIHGKTLVLLSNQETASVPEGVYVYRIQTTDTSGRKLTILTGQLVVVS